MVDDFRKIRVPKDIEPEVAILVEQIKLAAAESRTFNKEDVEFIKPKAKQFGGPELHDAIVYVALPVLGWITKAWFEENVLPIILKRLKKPTKQFIHWLERSFGAR